MSANHFYNTIDYAAQGRATDNWDGLKMWVAIKGQYEDIHHPQVNWAETILNDEYSAFRNQVLQELPEYDDHGNMNEPNHFIIQCLRIPFKNNMTQRRLMQVAYNIGQLKAVQHMYPEHYMQTFYDMKLHHIQTYFQ